ncbi:PadR family transcriptional regulator [Clostridium sp. UBA3887]|uniref:PadR family transcriptional regulator n=1 Tax=Clostridium sp. UBA3887 TaxID=1946356 RepID=UPI003217B77E
MSKTIKKLSEEKYIIKETTLYSAFTRLENNGYIESFYGDETFGKRRTYYRITQKGLDYYKEKCEEWKVIKEVMSKFIKEMDKYGDH